MPHNNGQYDPVAAAALSALNASERMTRQVERETPLPNLPRRSSAFSMTRSSIRRVSDFSPFNVLAHQDLSAPERPEILPESIPGPLELPQRIQSALPDSLPDLPTPGNGNGGNGSGGNGGNGSNGGNGGSGNGGNGSTSVAAANRGRSSSAQRSLNAPSGNLRTQPEPRR